MKAPLFFCLQSTVYGLQSTVNKQQSTDNGLQTTVNRQLSTDNGQQTTVNRQLSTDNGQQSTDYVTYSFFPFMLYLINFFFIYLHHILQKMV